MRALIRKTYYHFFPTQRPKEEGKKFDDTFFVNADGSLSLNHDSETVRQAFAKNVKTLQKMKEEK